MSTERAFHSISQRKNKKGTDSALKTASILHRSAAANPSIQMIILTWQASGEGRKVCVESLAATCKTVTEQRYLQRSAHNTEATSKPIMRRAREAAHDPTGMHKREHGVVRKKGSSRGHMVRIYVKRKKNAHLRFSRLGNTLAACRYIRSSSQACGAMWRVLAHHPHHAEQIKQNTPLTTCGEHPTHPQSQARQ